MRDNGPTDPRVAISPLPSLSPPRVHLPPRGRRPEKAKEINFIIELCPCRISPQKTRRRSNDLFFFFPSCFHGSYGPDPEETQCIKWNQFPREPKSHDRDLNHFFDRRSSKHREGLVIFFCIIPALCKKNVHNPCPPSDYVGENLLQTANSMLRG
jgi:hypothetical protein